MSELFNDKTIFTIDPNKDYSADLVGEGKTFKDVPALARGKVESDAFIDQLQKETKELRDELQKRLTLEEVMTKITQNKQIEPPPVTIPQGDQSAQPLTKEQLEALVAQTVSQRMNETEVERSAKTNFDTVISELKKVWGDGFQTVLANKAKELNLGQEWLTQLAGSQPKAFLTLVGADTKQTEVSPFGISPAGINTSALSASGNRGEKTAKYYSQLKVTDPKKYHTKEIQMEQYNQAIKLGERYFDLP